MPPPHRNEDRITGRENYFKALCPRKERMTCSIRVLSVYLRKYASRVVDEARVVRRDQNETLRAFNQDVKNITDIEMKVRDCARWPDPKRREPRFRTKVAVKNLLKRPKMLR